MCDFQEYENCEYPQRVGRQKHILDIDIHFKDTRSGGRARGGRGGGRGGPRLGGRPGQPGSISCEYSDKHAVRGRDTKSAPKVDDEHDFPSLG
uniref:Uncharacterized protein n=1 Tax=Rhodnius prolixus TaxID=13249 RepID=T1I8N6_RHOPR